MLCLSPKQHDKMFERLARNLGKSSEHVQESSVMFGSRRNTFGILRQRSEVIGKFSEIRVIWIQKSHVFDLGKVGRYISVYSVKRIKRIPYDNFGNRHQSKLNS